MLHAKPRPSPAHHCRCVCSIELSTPTSSTCTARSGCFASHLESVYYVLKKKQKVELDVALLHAENRCFSGPNRALPSTPVSVVFFLIQ